MLFFIQFFVKPWSRADVAESAALYRRAMLVLALHLVLLVMAVAGWWPLVMMEEDSYQLDRLIITGLVGGISVAALWLWLLLKNFRLTYWSRWVVTDFFITGLWGILLSVAHVLWTFNVQVDYHYGTPERIERVVVQRSCEIYCPAPKGIPISYILAEEDCTATQRVKQREQYQARHPECRADIRFTLGIRRWEKAQPEIFQFNVSEETYNAAPPGTPLIVPYYYGMLGIRWFDRDLILPVSLYGKNASTPQR